MLGDIILLFVGDMILVDLWLIKFRDLFISQVILIGEVIFIEKYDVMGVIVLKFVEVDVSSESELFELLNICLMGMNVVSGIVMVVVVVIGGYIYFGLFVKFIVGNCV